MRFSSLARPTLGILILSLVVACSGGGESGGVSDAAATVRTFYEHLNDGRYAEAKALYSTETMEQIFPDESAEAGFQDWAVVETHKGGLAEFSIVSETKSESGVVIEFELRFEDGESSQRRVTVSKENGAWRMGFIG